MVVADILTLIAATSAAIVSIITAWNTTRVRHEVRTMNEQTIGQLAANQETRRIEVIPKGDRTAREDRHMDQP